jgi:hypothetical protein
MGLAILRAAGCGSVFAGCGLKKLRPAGQIAGLTNFLWKFVKYEKYRIFPTSISSLMLEERQRKMFECSRKIYIIESLRKIDQGR